MMCDSESVRLTHSFSHVHDEPENLPIILKECELLSWPDNRFEMKIGRQPLRLHDFQEFRSMYPYPMPDWFDCPEIERSPETMSGAWVFKGTRVPVTALFENLKEGASLDQFLEWFPGVTKQQVQAVLEHEFRSLTTT